MRCHGDVLINSFQASLLPGHQPSDSDPTQGEKYIMWSHALKLALSLFLTSTRTDLSSRKLTHGDWTPSAHTSSSQRRFFCGMLGSMDLLASLNIVSDSINKMHSPLPLASHTQDTHTVHTLEKVRLLGETKLRHEITEDIYVQSSNLVIIKPMNFPSTCWHI